MQFFGSIFFSYKIFAHYKNSSIAKAQLICKNFTLHQQEWLSCSLCCFYVSQYVWNFSVKTLNTKCSHWCGCADPSVWVHSLQHTSVGTGFHEHDNSFLNCRFFWLYGAFCHAKVFNLYVVKFESIVLHCFWQACHKVKGSLSRQGFLESRTKQRLHKDTTHSGVGGTHTFNFHVEGRALSDINTKHVACHECLFGQFLSSPLLPATDPRPWGNRRTTPGRPLLLALSATYLYPPQRTSLWQNPTTLCNWTHHRFV